MNRRTLLTALAAGLFAPLAWLLKIEPKGIAGTRARRGMPAAHYGEWIDLPPPRIMKITEPLEPVAFDIDGILKPVRMLNLTIKKHPMPFKWPSELA